MGTEAVDDAEARARALSLLEATHQFPCEYAVTVIAFNQEAVTVQVKRAVRPDAHAGGGDRPNQQAETVHEMRASREGKYLSHRFAVSVANASEVLQLYARLREVEGVVTLL